MTKRAAIRKRPAAPGLSDRISQYLTMDRVVIGGSMLATVVIVAVLLLSSLNKQPQPIDLNIPDLSESAPVQGSEHIEQGETHPPYNSNPPTSGWMYARPANEGIYPDVLPDETLVHNLEHGGIWISYRDPDDEEMIGQLENIVNRYTGGVILTYRPQNETLIAVAAWGRLLTMDTVDSGQIHNFIARYRYKGPENTVF